MKTLTPKNIRNPKRASGFNYVAYKHPGELPAGHGGGKPYVAEYKVRERPVPAHAFRGPRRATALEAAQDYCNYMNSGQAPAPRPSLKSAGHKRSRSLVSTDPEYLATLGALRDFRAQKKGKQGHVYLIIEVNPGGGLGYGKVGYSTNPEARVAELQTGNPRPLALHAMTKGTADDEAALHAKYADRNVLQEWFRITKELLLEFDLDANGKPFRATV